MDFEVGFIYIQIQVHSSESYLSVLDGLAEE